MMTAFLVNLATNMELTIKEIPKKDAPCVAKIEKECFSTPFSEGDIQGYLDSPIWHFLGVYDGDKLLGYISFTLIIDECQIVNVAVSPTDRKRGAGSLLVLSMLDYIRPLGAKKAYLEVRESNIGAINLYKKHGFLPVGISKNHYSQPTENAILMNLEF